MAIKVFEGVAATDCNEALVIPIDAGFVHVIPSVETDTTASVASPPTATNFPRLFTATSSIEIAVVDPPIWDGVVQLVPSVDVAAIG